MIAFLVLISTVAPLIGWLADAQLGNYKIFKIGNVLIFLVSILNCIHDLVFENVRSKSVIIGVGILIMVYELLILGGEACLISLLKLGLDQMPDASSDNITSFIAWSGISYVGGLWLIELLFSLAVKCIAEQSKLVKQVLSIIPAIGASCMCCLMFLFSKWLIIEPKSPKALKNIYQVLKFAWKHKSPLNRSALTYWEEKIPSRMDLGKSRFGGPFTTEQVEDVKTFFKILVFFLPLIIVSVSTNSVQHIDAKHATNPSITVCASGLIYSFGYNSTVSCLMSGILYELLIYKFVRNHLPGILKRIGMTSFAMVTINTVYGVVKIAGLKYDIGGSDWSYMAHSIFIGPVHLCLVTQTIEFLCAQSPYKMRGLLMGYGVYIYLVPYLLCRLLNTGFDLELICKGQNCILIHSCLSIALSLTGFILYCLVARWYKMRVRDEDYDVHRVVEEVYDRYLMQYSEST